MSFFCTDERGLLPGVRKEHAHRDSDLHLLSRHSSVSVSAGAVGRHVSIPPPPSHQVCVNGSWQKHEGLDCSGFYSFIISRIEDTYVYMRPDVSFN